MKLACLVTAAGSGSRFGRDKLLLPIDGQPMGVRALSVFSEAAFDLRVLITSADKGYMMEAAGSMGFDLVLNPAPEQGMSVSVRLGTAHILSSGAYDGILYAVADQPHLSADTVKRLAEAFLHEPRYIWAPVADGRRGNPVIFPAFLFAELLEVEGDRGGRQVIAAHPELLRTIDVSSTELKDIDTKEDMRIC